MSRARGEPVRKQFFAGTACPHCRALDKVRRCEDANGVVWLECLACGYTQDLTDGYVDPDEAGPLGAGTADDVPRPVTWRPR